MTVIGTAEVEVRSDSSRFAKDAENDIKGAMGGVTDSVNKSAKVIGGALAGAFAVDKVVGFAGSVISAASDMGETLSKSKNVFGDQAAAIEEWASTSAVSFGISKQAALAATAQYGDMFKQLGFTGTAAKDASTNLIKTAADLGSFHNVDPSDVLERIGASLRGEFDSLQQLIPNLNAARVETEALAMTGKKAAKELTAQEKATATLAIIQKDGALSANDFAETSDGLANRQRILAAQFEDVKAKIGAGLLPIMTSLAGFVLDNMIPAFEATAKVVGKVGDVIGDVIGKLDIKSKLGGVTEAFQSTFSGEGWEAHGIEEKVGGSLGGVAIRIRDAKATFTEAFQFALTPDGWEAHGAVEKVAVALADLTKYFHETFDEIVAFTQTKWPEIQEAIGHVMNAIQDVISVVTVVIEAIWSRFGDNILQAIQNRMELIKRLIDDALEILKSTITLALAIINGDWDKAWNSILNIFSAVWDAMKAVLSFSLAEMKNILAVGWDAIKAATSLAWEGIKIVVSAVLDAMKFLFFNFSGPGLLIKHWDTIKSATNVTFGDVKKIISDAWDAVISTLKGLGGRIAGATGGMWDGIKNAFKDAINAIIRGWNGLQFKTPSFDAGPIHYDGVTVGVPDIPYLAKGGVVRSRSGGTAAIIGEGGSDEAVVPLNQGFVQMLVAAMVQAGVGGKQGSTVENLTIMNSKTLQENLDEVDRLSSPLIGVY